MRGWPREERGLSRAERLELQQHLLSATASTSASRAGGGQGTAPPSAAFRRRTGLVPDGFATVAVLERLRAR